MFWKEINDVKYEKYLHDLNNFVYFTYHCIVIINIGLFMINMLRLTQYFSSPGHSNTVSSLSGRIAHATVLLGGLVISVHYSSWLYSSLTVFIPVFPFNGFQSLLDDGSQTLGVVKGFSIKTELKLTNRVTFKVAII